ncbi:MAG: NUDIX hydrolase [Nitrospirae bacterium CG_4_9_14_3_um_filter_44_28]|nr:MAG: NUDIX hydrolase [Nitrospirae bacterium CG_4_9_14_3_um_filter_44_28]
MSDNTEELLEVTDKSGKTIGIAPRAEIHGNPALIHRVVHVLVFNKKGALFLQKRSETKDVAPGKWDTSVGGHVSSGENLLEAAKREMEEELGISESSLEFLYSYIHTNPYETEIVHTYSCVYDGKISFNKEEIDEVRLWDFGEIKNHLGRDIFSDNFEHEITTYLNKPGQSLNR